MKHNTTKIHLTFFESRSY